MEKENSDLESAIQKELSIHPEIQTAEDKHNFIKTKLDLDENEMNKILQITKENPNINPFVLDQTFTIASLLSTRFNPETLPEVIKRKAPDLQDKTAFETMADGQTTKVLKLYLDVINWDYRG